MFQSTHPGWGATKGDDGLAQAHLEFQSTHPGWGATKIALINKIGTMFQSTHPGWGATFSGDSRCRANRFQSTHPGWGATSSLLSTPHLPSCFNPRTPGGVRPWMMKRIGFGTISFNPRTPGGVRRPCRLSYTHVFAFQSTHHGWGATFANARGHDCTKRFNPRTPGGVRRDPRLPGAGLHVSIHAPRVGCDEEQAVILIRYRRFNPRTPGGVRRNQKITHFARKFVSIHAPRVGCDLCLAILRRAW